MPVVGPFLTGQEIENVWVEAGGDPANAQLAAAVALAESSGGTRSYNVNSNGSTDYGLWQINSAAHGGSEADYDPATAAAAAVRISRNGADWTQWCTAYTDGACGHKGGVYAPTGSSPAGANYRTLSHEGVVPTVTRSGKRLAGQATSIGKAATRSGDTTANANETASRLPAAFKHLAHALGVTVPTQTALVDRVTNNYTRIVSPHG